MRITPPTALRRRHAGLLGLVACLAITSLPAAAAVHLDGVWQSTVAHPRLLADDGALPFTARGRQMYAANQRSRAAHQYDDYDYTTSRCAAPGVPRVMLTPEHFRILQQPDLIEMEFQWNRFRRAIQMPTLPKQTALFGGSEDAIVGSMMGTSKGHWEGDTLVVVTDQFSDRTLLDDLVPHGYDLKVTERLRLTSPDTLEDQFTVEDPEYFTRPWHALLTYRRQSEAILPEEVCLDKLKGQPPLPTTAGTAPTGPEAQPANGLGFGIPRLDGLKVGANGFTTGPGGGLELELERNGFTVPPLPSLPPGLPAPASNPRDLSGSWYGEQYLAEFEYQTDMFGSKVPFTALGRKIFDRRLQAQDQRHPYITPAVICRPSGPDWDTIFIPLRIFQTSRRIDLLSDTDRAWWQIALNPAIALPADNRSYMGRSVGHWEGDTLVVETQGFKDRLWLTFRGVALSPTGKLIHRIRKIHGDHWYLEIVTTVIDPNYYTRPWQFVRTFMWRPDMGVPSEYNCEEQVATPGNINNTGAVPEPQD